MLYPKVDNFYIFLPAVFIQNRNEALNFLQNRLQGSTKLRGL